jgi:RNA polymerase sigma-70 factor (ECF subfamily)
MVASLTTEVILRTLLGARPRIAAGLWLLVHDVHLAEDLFQEVVVRAVDGRSSFSSAEELLAWARVTGRNAALNLLRSRGRERTVLKEELLNSIEGAAQTEPEKDGLRAKALRECMESLPDRSRKILNRRYFAGRSGEEVARDLKMTREAVYQALLRIHQALGRCVESKLGASSA